MGFLGFLGTPLGYVLQWMYNLFGSYGWALIVFTIAVRLCSFPLQIGQQKNTARMAAYKPMIDEIQKKYAKDRDKQNEELMRLQQEYGYNPTAGCLPMFVNFFIMFGVIEAVYYPLQHILHISKDVLTQIADILGQAYNYTTNTAIIQMVHNNTLPSEAAALLTSDGTKSFKEHESLLPVCHRVAQLPKYQVIFHDESISGYVVNQIYQWQRPRLVPSFMKELGIAKKEAEMLTLFIINGTYSVNKALHWTKDETWYQVHSMLLKYTVFVGYTKVYISSKMIVKSLVVVNIWFVASITWFVLSIACAHCSFALLTTTLRFSNSTLFTVLARSATHDRIANNGACCLGGNGLLLMLMGK